jgi:putative transposase
MGKRNNQNFVYIPFSKLVSQIKYKSDLMGIEVILEPESYTSKCSFLDAESIEKHVKYQGRRICRGLYCSQRGIIINADVNGAYNILKKAVPNAISADGIEGVGLHPYSIVIS